MFDDIVYVVCKLHIIMTTHNNKNISKNIDNDGYNTSNDNNSHFAGFLKKH